MVITILVIEAWVPNGERNSSNHIMEYNGFGLEELKCKMELVDNSTKLVAVNLWIHLSSCLAACWLNSSYYMHSSSRPLYWIREAYDTSASKAQYQHSYQKLVFHKNQSFCIKKLQTAQTWLDVCSRHLTEW